MQGALLEELIREVPDALGERRKIAALYSERLKGHVRLQEGALCRSAYTCFAIILKDQAQRDAAAEALSREKITFALPKALYPPETGRRGEWARVILVNAGQAVKRALLLPMHRYLTSGVVNFICDIVIGGL